MERKKFIILTFIFLLIPIHILWKGNINIQLKPIESKIIYDIDVYKDSTWIEDTHFHLDNKCLHTIGHYIYCYDTILIELVRNER